MAAKLDLFLSADVLDATQVNNVTALDIYGDIFKDRGSTALWFYPAAVSILILHFSLLE